MPKAFSARATRRQRADRLLDTGHVHHERAGAWLAQNLQYGWASCPITQNRCIMSQTAYPNPKPAAAVAQRLAEAAAAPHHRFWPDDISLLEPDTFNWSSVLGARQVTDAYLLALAVRNSGRFVTFDGGVAVTTVPGADTGHLVVL